MTRRPTIPELLHDVAAKKLLAVLEDDDRAGDEVDDEEEDSEEPIGRIEVESGLLVIGDPALLASVLDEPSKVRNATRKAAFVSKRGSMAFRLPQGEYEVLGVFDENDTLVEIRVVLDGNDDGEEEPDVIDADWVEVTQQRERR